MRRTLTILTFLLAVPILLTFVAGCDDEDEVHYHREEHRVGPARHHDGGPRTVYERRTTIESEDWDDEPADDDEDDIGIRREETRVRRHQEEVVVP